MYVRLFQVYGSMVSKIYYHGFPTSRAEEGMGIGLEKDDHLLRPDPYLNHQKKKKRNSYLNRYFLTLPFYAVLMSYPIILGSVHEP